MKHMDLFSGIGGFALAASWVWGDEHEIVTFCEKEEFPRQVLKKHWPDVPCVKDIHNLRGDEYGAIDLITGGFPCQPFSTAGKQRGAEDDRALWPEMFRVIKEAKPRVVLGENVANFQNMELDKAISDLEREGFEVGSFIIPACGINAPHKRRRVWIVAYSTLYGISNEAKGTERIAIEWDTVPRLGFGGGDMGCRENTPQGLARWGEWRHNGWEVEPGVARVANGVSSQVDRNRGIGNAIVPQVAAVIMSGIKDVDRVL